MLSRDGAPSPTMSGSTPLQQALAALERRDYATAAEVAGRAAQGAPQDAEPLRILGVAQLRLGSAREAVASLRRALKLDPLSAACYHALGNALQEQGQLEAAIHAYRRALRFDKAALAAHNDLGTALFAQGRLDEAIRAFQDALAQDPDQPAVLENLGSALRRAGRFGEARAVLMRSLRARIAMPFRRLLRRHAPRPAATTPSTLKRALQLYAGGHRSDALALCDEALRSQPQDPEALHLKGLILLEAKQPEEAHPLLERAVALAPQVAEFHNTLGLCHAGRGATQEALRAFQRALQANPQLVPALVNLSGVFSDSEDHAAAERAARTALASEPDHAGARRALIRALLGRGEHAAAEAASRQLVEAEPDSPEARLFLGSALREQGRLDEASQAFEQALLLGPRNHLVHLTAGAFALECRRDADAAIRHYRRAREISPESGSASFNEALARFAKADYSRAAWDLYEARRLERARVAAYRKVRLPEWNGQPEPGRHLLIYAEQGIGDELMFASMVPEAARLVGRCTFACDPRLQPLFARSFAGVRAIPWAREMLEADAPELDGADVAIPLASLGRFLRTSAQALFRGPYLQADPDRVAAWRARLQAFGAAPYRGIAWQGGLWSTGRGRRSLELCQLANALQAAAGSWVSLQLGADQGAIDREGLEVPLTHWNEALASVDETAALVSALDEVVSVCSWIVHLCGALGKPVTVLAPFAAEWRYGLQGDAMPWYGSAHLLRQAAFGDWPSVVQKLQARLQGGAPA